MTEDRLVSLIIRCMAGELTPKEAWELQEWAEEAPENQLLLDKNLDEKQLRKEINQWKKIDPSEGYATWLAGRKVGRRRRVLRFGGWSVAASLLVAVVIFGMVQKMRPSVRPNSSFATTVRPIMPGRNAATLTLSDGQQVLLDSASNGQLAIQGNSRLVKPADGSLSYLAAEDGTSPAMVYNVLATPRSGQYQLTLPDGSKVWLNNVSSLRYPTSFPGKDRTVELTGEAYFEITKDPVRPFVVKVKGETVEVLGTSFNIMAYSEEGNMQTTLLMGAVRVKAGNTTLRLKPDEQAQVNGDGSLRLVKDVPSQDIVSWKDGFFYFGRAPFAAVLRQLARWYDVEVVYEGKAPEMEFGGKIDRNLPLNDLLQYLNQNQIHLRLEGRKLIVLPN